MKRKIQINNTQVTYVKKRIDEISKKKRDEITRKYAWTKPKISVSDKIKFIQSGKYSILERLNPDIETNIDWVVVFEEAKDPYVKDRADALVKLESQRIELMDNLMLGDVDEALEMLNNFSKTEY